MRDPPARELGPITLVRASITVGLPPTYNTMAGSVLKKWGIDPKDHAYLSMGRNRASVEGNAGGPDVGAIEGYA